jgi:hypothetical protein
MSSERAFAPRRPSFLGSSGASRTSACPPSALNEIRLRRPVYTSSMDNPERFIELAAGRIKCLRCTARSKNTRQQCRKPALKASRTQKCQFHGGRGSGPKTPEGRARIGTAHKVHGRETNEKRLERAQGALRMAQLEDVMYVLRMTKAARSVGRKPVGYKQITTIDEVKAWVAEDAFQGVRGIKPS